ncbi:MAG: hypothetical protein U0R19_08805 [Bryobacteraceae bacterium]
MPVVPISQTGSTARYPLVSRSKFHNASISFVGGAEQYYPFRRAASQTWQLQYEGLSEKECGQWLEFLNQEIRIQSSFVYLDAVTGVSHPNSLIDDEGTSVEQMGVDNSRVTLTIRKEGA